MKKLLVVILLGMLSACVNTSDPNAVSSATQASFDPYTKQMSVISKTAQMDGAFPNIGSYNLQYRYKSGAEPVVQLYFEYWSQLGWYFFSSASDIDAIALPVAELDKTVGSGSVTETIIMTISEQYLANHRTSGLNIRVNGKRGAVILNVPGPYVDGFLKKLNEVKAANGLTTQPTASNTPTRKLGLNFGYIPAPLATAASLPSNKGIYIVSVSKNSVAERSGLQVGDILFENTLSLG